MSLFLYTHNAEPGKSVLVNNGDYSLRLEKVDLAFSYDHVRLYQIKPGKIQVEILAKVGPGDDDLDFVKFWQPFTKLPPYLEEVVHLFQGVNKDRPLWKKGKRTSEFLCMKAGAALVWCEGDNLSIKFSPNTQFWLPGWDEIEDDGLTVNFLEIV